MKQILFLMFFLFSVHCWGQIADKETYLNDFKEKLKKECPQARPLFVVFHGHSVPAGYSVAPEVETFRAYPQLFLYGLKAQYPTSVVSVITTSIGGEDSQQGAKRFENEVLVHRPDVLFIDYGLNDRRLGVERSEAAWRKMIEAALQKGIKVMLMTPTPDQRVDILDGKTSLERQAALIRKLAAEYHVGLIDSYALFREKIKQGNVLKKYMSGINHPNILGHMCVTSEILPWFY